MNLNLETPPRLNWLNGKTYKSAFGARAGRSGLSTEHAQANKDSRQNNVDTCLVCPTEIPPGPDFCSSKCEEKANETARLSPANG